MYFKIVLNLSLFAITVEARLNGICDLHSNDIMEQCFFREILISIPHNPNQMAVHSSTNNLYFSFDFGDREYMPAILSIDTKDLLVLTGVKDAFAVAANQTGEDIFFGGGYGIYKYIPHEKRLKRLARENLDVWELFINGNIIYFIQFPSLNVYRYYNREVEQVPELENVTVHQLVFDNDNNMFFINATGLFTVKKETGEVIAVKKNTKFLSLAVDRIGNVYVSDEKGIYTVAVSTVDVIKIINLHGVMGMTFDKENNLVYTNSQELTRLLPLNTEKYRSHYTSITILR